MMRSPTRSQSAPPRLLNLHEPPRVHGASRTFARRHSARSPQRVRRACCNSWACSNSWSGLSCRCHRACCSSCLCLERKCSSLAPACAFCSMLCSNTRLRVLCCNHPAFRIVKQGLVGHCGDPVASTSPQRHATCHQPDVTKVCDCTLEKRAHPLPPV